MGGAGDARIATQEFSSHERCVEAANVIVNDLGMGIPHAQLAISNLGMEQLTHKYRLICVPK